MSDAALPTTNASSDPKAKGQIAPTIVRILLGLMFLLFGLNGFLNFIPAPKEMPAYSLSKGQGQARRGGTIFMNACASCHGDNGAGIVDGDRRRNKILAAGYFPLVARVGDLRAGGDELVEEILATREMANRRRIRSLSD